MNITTSFINSVFQIWYPLFLARVVDTRLRSLYKYYYSSFPTAFPITLFFLFLIYSKTSWNSTSSSAMGIFFPSLSWYIDPLLRPFFPGATKKQHRLFNLYPWICDRFYWGQVINFSRFNFEYSQQINDDVWSNLTLFLATWHQVFFSSMKLIQKYIMPFQWSIHTNYLLRSCNYVF